MIERVDKSWRLFASGEPGRRFRERYGRRRSSGRGRFHPVRLLHVGGGVALVAVSALFGWLPVLGWGTVVLGLGMVAGEVYSAARLMDWAEVRARRLFGPLGRAFVGLTARARLFVSVAIAVSTFALVYCSTRWSSEARAPARTAPPIRAPDRPAGRSSLPRGAVR